MKIQIQKPIRANDSSMEEEDIFSVKKALNSLGYYKRPVYGLTPYSDRGLFEGIKIFQKENDLNVDGVLNPQGETETEINKKLKIAAKSPILWCEICGGPHGGVNGKICSWCHAKL